MPAGNYELAQLNIARMLAPKDSPQLADFVANLDRINALAERAPGFVWRLKDDSGSAMSFQPFGDDIIVNLSVWRDVESLRGYVYESGHVDIMRRRAEWFARLGEAHLVLWWVPARERPNLEEANERLTLLREHGPTNRAFTIKSPFPPPAR